MRFVRFGVLKPVRQEGYDPSYGADVSELDFRDEECFVRNQRDACDYFVNSHEPPCASGFYAQPFGFCDFGIISTDDSSEKNRCRMIKLHDDDGNPVEMEQIVKEEVRNGKERAVLTSLGRAMLKRYGVTKNLLINSGVCGTSYVRVMRDWRHPPKLLPSGRLNQKLAYLTDDNGRKFTASDVFGGRDWSLADYKWDESHHGDGFQYVTIEDIKAWWDFNAKVAAVENLNGTGPDRFRLFLALKKLDVRQLCVWPIYDDWSVAVFKRPHVFEYQGMIWHHLGMYLKSGEMQGVRQGQWFRSSVAAFEAALRRYGRRWMNYPEVSEDMGKYYFNLKKAGRRIAKLKKTPMRNKPGACCDTEGMIEVFIEERDWRNAGRKRS